MKQFFILLLLVINYFIVVNCSDESSSNVESENLKETEKVEDTRVESTADTGLVRDDKPMPKVVETQDLSVKDATTRDELSSPVDKIDSTELNTPTSSTFNLQTLLFVFFLLLFFAGFIFLGVDIILKKRDNRIHPDGIL